MPIIIPNGVHLGAVSTAYELRLCDALHALAVAGHFSTKHSNEMIDQIKKTQEKFEGLWISRSTSADN